jgi:prevent-host-death family protein
VTGYAVEVSVREAKARFTEVATAAAGGERVVVTKHGRPFVELVAAKPAGGMDFAKAAEVRRAMGLDGVTIKMPDNFDDPAFSRDVLGLED